MCAQVVGSAIAISLLTYNAVPLWAGVLITAVASFLLLLLEQAGVRLLEAVFAVLIGTMALSFGVMYVLAGVPTARVVEGGARGTCIHVLSILLHVRVGRGPSSRRLAAQLSFAYPLGQPEGCVSGVTITSKEGNGQLQESMGRGARTMLLMYRARGRGEVRAQPDQARCGGLPAGLLVPRLPRSALQMAVAIVGAGIMPANFYLHSALVHSRWAQGLVSTCTPGSCTLGGCRVWLPPALRALALQVGAAGSGKGFRDGPTTQERARQLPAAVASMWVCRMEHVQEPGARGLLSALQPVLGTPALGCSHAVDHTCTRPCWGCRAGRLTRPGTRGSGRRSRTSP